MLHGACEMLKSPPVPERTRTCAPARGKSSLTRVVKMASGPCSTQSIMSIKEAMKGWFRRKTADGFSFPSGVCGSILSELLIRSRAVADL